MAHLLGAESLHLEYPTRVVFDDVTVGVAEGDRIGIVGRNGDGKSSLIGMLLGTVTPDAGRVTRRGGVRATLLDQSDTLDGGHTVGHAIVGDRPEHEWAGDAKVRDVIDGLVSDLDWHARVATLSGGQRRRVALAATLVGDWDVIGLDEPTNHLDVEGITWLAQHLKGRWRKDAGGLLIITHDRWFLDEVATATWEVHDRIVEPFEGGYAAYVLQRVERDRQAAAAEAKRQNMMRKELAWLRRGAPARTSKPKFRIDAANQLIEDVPPLRDRIALSRLATARLGKDVVDLIDASVSFGDRPVLRDVEWRIGPGDRTAILGANGAGKTTLLRLIAGDLAPTSGRVKRGKTVKLAMLDQQFSQLEEIADDRVREVLARTRTTYEVDGKEMTPAQLLERLGFAREHLSARVKDLSGGQKRRLQLLLVLLDEPNFLVLDEPSNDVDTDMLAAMEDLLDSWPGNLIVVSHDRYLLERVTDQQYAVLDGRLRHLPGGVDEYLRLRAAAGDSGSRVAPLAAEKPRATSGAAGSGQSGAAGSGTTDARGPSAAEQRAARKRIATVERRLTRLSEQIDRLHEQMAEHDHTDYEGLAELTAKLRDLESQTGELEDTWLELAEAAG